MTTNWLNEYKHKNQIKDYKMIEYLHVHAHVYIMYYYYVYK